MRCERHSVWKLIDASVIAAKIKVRKVKRNSSVCRHGERVCRNGDLCRHGDEGAVMAFTMPSWHTRAERRVHLSLVYVDTGQMPSWRAR